MLYAIADTLIPENLSSLPKLAGADISFLMYPSSCITCKDHEFISPPLSLIVNGSKKSLTFPELPFSAPTKEVLNPGDRYVYKGAPQKLALSNSLIVTFPAYRVTDFLNRTHMFPYSAEHLNNSPASTVSNTFLDEYISTICGLIKKEVPVSPHFILHKFEELLLLLWEHFSLYVSRLFHALCQHSAFSIRDTVEDDLNKNLSVAELAHLSCKSLSSFKREFAKEYGRPPGRYLRERKLKKAALELLQGKTPSQLYLEYGYGSLSNFTQAFKRQFQITPKAFRLSSSVNIPNNLTPIHNV